jgi:hypothetical protein
MPTDVSVLVSAASPYGQPRTVTGVRSGAFCDPGIVFPAGTAQLTLLVQRQNPAAGSTVAFVVADICGDWASFVGGGPGSF